MSAASKVASFLLAAWLAFGTLCELRADEGSTKSNAEVMSEVCGRAMEKFCAESKIPDTASVSVNIGTGEANGFFAPVFVQVLRQHFSTLYSRHSNAATEISVSIGGVSVQYGEAFSEGMFSGQLCKRTIEVSVRLSVTRNEDGKLLWADTETASQSDTVYVSAIRELQRTSLSVSSGVEPAPSLLERFLEPVIIGGAAGVVVYLFFTIRS